MEPLLSAPSPNGGPCISRVGGSPIPRTRLGSLREPMGERVLRSFSDERSEPPQVGRTLSRSNTEPLLPIKRLIENGAHIFHKGFGGVRSAYEQPPDTASSCCSSGVIWLLASAFVSLSFVVYIDVEPSDGVGEPFFKPDPKSLDDAYICLALIPVACATVNYIVQHLRQTTFWWERKQKVTRTCCSRTEMALMLVPALWLLRQAIEHAANERPASHLCNSIEILSAFILLRLYFGMLDTIDSLFKGLVKDQEDINKTRPVRKMREIVQNITRSGRIEKDVVYCFPDLNTVPAEVLSYTWWVYYFVGKILGSFLALAVAIDVDHDTVIHLFAGSIFLSAVTSVGVFLELGPNSVSLLRLSLNKPFYVGDLVTLNTNGAMEGSTSIVGFVENITMMYVVIRNFEMKQTWISHKAFSEMIIQNWTRRPTKTVLLNIGITARCPIARVEHLLEFAKKWIRKSTEIQQSNYQKYNLTKVANGYNIEIIFFPSVGVSHRGIRQKFLLAFMKAGERLRVPFVPLNLFTNFCDETCTVDAEHVNLPQQISKASVSSDGLETPYKGVKDEKRLFGVPLVNLDDLLPDPNDLLPLGVE